MICHGVRLQLSAFLERSLDAIRMKSIETHLNSCPGCRAEATDLSECIRQVGELPMIDPPVGFAQRVMTHVREIEVAPRGWRKFVAPFRTTVSIPAAAAVIVAVLAVFFYNSDPRVTVSDAVRLGEPLALHSPVAPETGSITAVTELQMPPRASSPEPTRDAGPANVSRQAIDARTAQAPETLSVKDQTAAQARAARQERPDNRVATLRRPPIQAQEVATGRGSFRPGTEAHGFGAAIGALSEVPFRIPPFAGVERALSPLSEPRADIELIVRRRPWQRGAQVEEANEDVRRKRSEADAAVASAAARRAVPAPGLSSSSIVEMRWFGVPSDRYEQFRDQLAAEAYIDSERAISGIDKEGAQQLLIKVIILPSDR